MEETATVPSTAPKTSATDEKPDFYVGRLQGLIPDSLNDMHAQGMYANNFSIEDPEAYWGKKSVKDAFTMPDGGVRRDLFDESYKKALSEYSTHRDSELNLVNFMDSYPTVTAQRLGVHTPTPQVFKTKEDPQGRDYVSGLAFSDPFSAQKRSLKEIAIEDVGVKQANGTYTPTKDFTGQAKFAMDEKGQVKFNEDGKPYLVPVKDGEQLHQWDTIYRPLTEKLGGYGYDYSIGNVLASVVKNPINMLARSVDDMIEYGRGLMDITGIGGKEGQEAVNKVETLAKSFEIPSTEKNQGSILNVENTVDIAQQAFWQLAAMAGVGAGVTALTKNPKAGQIAGRVFMTAISAGYMAEVARDNKLTKNESALLLAITTAGIWHLMPLEEAVLGSLKTGESSAALIKAMGEDPNVAMKVVDAVRRPTTSKLRSLALGIGEAAKTFVSTDKFRSAVFKLENTAPALVGAGGEAIEEFAEQGLDLAVRAGYNAYSAADDDSRHPFQIDLANEISQLGQASLGGAIGGAAVHSAFSRLLKNHPEQAQEFHDMVMDGKEQVLRDFASRMHAQGRLDHDWLTTDGKITKPSSGDSRNDANYKVLNGIVDYLVELRDASGIGEAAKNNIAEAKSLFAGVISSSSVGKDAASLNADLIRLSGEIEKAKAATNPNKDFISSLSEELKVKQDALQKIVKGDFVADYVTEGLYNTLSATSKDSSFSPDRLSGKEFNALLSSMPEHHRLAMEAFAKAQEGQEAADKAATVHSPEGASEARLRELAEEAKKDYNSKYSELSPHVESFNNATEDGLIYENLHPDSEIKSRNQEIDVLKNTILPSLAQTPSTETPVQGPPLEEVIAGHEAQRASELAKVSRPKVDLPYITDQGALSRSIQESVTDNDGNIEPRTITIGEKQEVIRKKARKLEQLAKCVYG